MNTQGDLTSSPVLNAKLQLLSHGLRVDFDSLRREFGTSLPAFRTVSDRAVVADRTFLDVIAEERRLVPDELLLEDEQDSSVVKVCYAPDSPIELAAAADGRLRISREDGRALPVSVQLLPIANYGVRPGESVRPDRFASVVGTDRLSIIPYDGCDYWSSGGPCSFCGSNPLRLGTDGIKPSAKDAKHGGPAKFGPWWQKNRERVRGGVGDALTRLLASGHLGPHLHLLMIAGNLPDADEQWHVLYDVLDVVSRLANLSAIDTHCVMMPPRTLDLITPLARDFGFHNVAFNLEVWGEDDFAGVCPGKQRSHGWDAMIAALRHARSVFDEGHVRTNFVLGAQELGRTLDGARAIAAEGIVPDYTVFFRRPSTAWSARRSPSPSDILAFAIAVDDLYREQGFSPVYCRHSSRSSVASEVREWRATSSHK